MAQQIMYFVRTPESNELLRQKSAPLKVATEWLSSTFKGALLDCAETLLSVLTTETKSQPVRYRAPGAKYRGRRATRGGPKPPIPR